MQIKDMGLKETADYIYNLAANMWDYIKDLMKEIRNLEEENGALKGELRRVSGTRNLIWQLEREIERVQSIQEVSDTKLIVLIDKEKLLQPDIYRDVPATLVLDIISRVLAKMVVSSEARQLLERARWERGLQDTRISGIGRNG